MSLDWHMCCQYFLPVYDLPNGFLKGAFLNHSHHQFKLK